MQYKNAFEIRRAFALSLPRAVSAIFATGIIFVFWQSGMFFLQPLIDRSCVCMGKLLGACGLFWLSDAPDHFYQRRDETTKT
jgi:hypothetical protein